MSEFTVGAQYTRKEVFRVLGLHPHPTGGNWFTGYQEHDDRFFVFCNVGVPGRTGHDYENRFVGDELCWFAKSSTRLQQPQIQRLLDPDRPVLVFWRVDDMDPFTYQGTGTPVKFRDGTEDLPVFIRWAFNSSDDKAPESLPEEVARRGSYPEGARKRISVNSYERDPAARLKCLKHWGRDCVVCGFNFREVYGELGEGFIHVHHLLPLSEVGSDYRVNPIEDLRPVCPNCHWMLHRRDNPMEIDALRKLVAANA